MRKFSSILIVGVGSIGKRHFSLFKKYFEKIDLCDVNLGRCKSIMKDNKKIINKIGSNFSKMISKNNYKVVCITTPPHMHLKIAELAIKSNANIFIEKPLGMNNKGWKKISLECKKKKLINFIAYCHRFIPYTKILKDILKSNKIGKVHFVNLRWGSYLPDWHPYEDYRSFYMSKKSQGGGALMDESHGIDLLRYLFGEIKSVYADVKNISELELSSDDAALLTLEFKNGINCHANFDLISRYPRVNIEIIGSKGNIIWDRIDPEIKIYSSIEKKWRVQKFKKEDTLSMYNNQAKFFVHLLSSRKIKNFLDIDDAMKTQNIIDKSFLSSKKMKKINL